MKKATILTAGGLLVILGAIFLPPCSHSSGLPHAADLSNMRHIAQGLAIYAMENEGRYPDSLAELFDPHHDIFEEGDHHMLIYSRAHYHREKDHIPVEDIDQVSDWIYVRGHTRDSPKDAIVLFYPVGGLKDYEGGEVLVVRVSAAAEVMEVGEFSRAMMATLAHLHSPSQSN